MGVIYTNIHSPHIEVKDNWEGVAKRVNAASTTTSSSTKTAAECLAKFLSLPLEKEGKKEGASEWVRGLAAGVDGRGA